MKLELKEKNGTTQRKRSILLDREEAACMIRGEYGFLREHEEELALHLYLLMTQKCYRPKCVVTFPLRQRNVALILGSTSNALYPSIPAYPVTSAPAVKRQRHRGE